MRQSSLLWGSILRELVLDTHQHGGEEARGFHAFLLAEMERGNFDRLNTEMFQYHRLCTCYADSPFHALNICLEANDKNLREEKILLTHKNFSLFPTVETFNKFQYLWLVDLSGNTLDLISHKRKILTNICIWVQKKINIAMLRQYSFFCLTHPPIPKCKNFNKILERMFYILCLGFLIRLDLFIYFIHTFHFFIYLPFYPMT